MKPMDGRTLLREVKSRYPTLPVILMTAYGDIPHAVEAMRTGASNYLPKPFEPDVLVAEVARHMLPAGADGSGEVIGSDPRTMEMLDLARRVASAEVTVLLTGESGTGKEVLARFIHRHSTRSKSPFVAVNCAAIPENLLESTLFGFEKGAFTGASQSHAGKFEQAQGGTLLLDEISEMPLSLQAKLLRVLQEREVERVGGKKPVPVDIRVIATSNRNMRVEIEQGRFREDLFYRLNVFPIELPALRHRPGDIPELARHVLARAGRGARCKSLTENAVKSMVAYPWPGNIRELENVLQRAQILAPGDVIDEGHLGLPKTIGSIRIPVSSSRQVDPALNEPQDLKTLERSHILETLAAVKGVRKAAAARLGMSERTLRHKLQHYRIEGKFDG
jgi:two-component system response regulator FlrC